MISAPKWKSNKPVQKPKPSVEKVEHVYNTQHSGKHLRKIRLAISRMALEN